MEAINHKKHEADDDETYPITIELTVWRKQGIHQYKITINEQATITHKRTDNVLYTRSLSASELNQLMSAIQNIEIPALEYVHTNSENADSSYALLIQSAHFCLEVN